MSDTSGTGVAAAIVELEAVLFDLPKYRKMNANEAEVYERRAWKARAKVADAARAIEKRAEVAEKAIANWRQYCDDAQREVSVSRMEMWSLRKRVASLEAQLAAVPDYVDYCAAAAAAGVMPDTLEIWLLSQQEEQP